eukprot:4651238-Alexandrium_andersonii.AAC.1
MEAYQGTTQLLQSLLAEVSRLREFHAQPHLLQHKMDTFSELVGKLEEVMQIRFAAGKEGKGE